MIGPWRKTPAAAEYLGVSTRKLREWIARGMIKGREIDGTAYFSVEQLDEFMLMQPEFSNRVDRIVQVTLKEFEQETCS